jgi:hypothetical protein
MELREYLDTIAAELVNELRPILQIRGVTANTDLLGMYAEAAVRSLVHRIVSPMRACTGAALDYPVPVVLRQIDIIIWAPFPVPALFDVEGFGLVPKSSAFGVIEVKRSNYTGVEDKIEEFLADVDTYKIVAEPGASVEDYRRKPGIGIICVLEASPSTMLQSLIEAGKVAAIFEKAGDTARIRGRDILNVVNFLRYVTWRNRSQSSGPAYPQVITDP